jgi:transposase, IS5 family
VVGQAKRFSTEVAAGVKRASDVVKQLALEGLREKLDAMVPLVKKVMKQTRARIMRGDTRTEGKVLSLFEPTTEVIRKGKAGKPNEFGKMVKLQEAENQIVIDFDVYDQRPNDADLLVPAIDIHQAALGRMPRLVAADAAFYSAKNEAAAKAKGVKRVCVPNRSTNSAERRREQKKRWFRNGQKWRTGCEGRISVAKRRHGLNRSRYKGTDGMNEALGRSRRDRRQSPQHRRLRRGKPGTPIESPCVYLNCPFAAWAGGRMAGAAPSFAARQARSLPTRIGEMQVIIADQAGPPGCRSPIAGR